MEDTNRGNLAAEGHVVAVQGPVVDVRFDFSCFGIIYRSVELRFGTCEDGF